MKRLLCIVSSMNVGGAETFLMKLYDKMDRSLYRLDFCICSADIGVYEKKIQEYGGKIFHITPKSQGFLKYERELKAVIKDNQYKYVFRTAANAMAFLDLSIAKNAGARVCTFRSSNSSDGASFKKKVAHRLGQILYANSVDIKIAPSDLAARYTFGDNAWKKGEVTILHNGLDLQWWHYSEDGRSKIRTELGITSDTKVIGHIGRFDIQKNHEFLVDIFYAYHSINSDSVLLLVGDGNRMQRIKEKVSILNLTEHVKFLGLRTDVPDILSAMDVMVMPSFHEGMPNSVIEAQSTGLKCLISDTITKEANITGLVQYLPLGDNEIWAKKINESIDYIRLDYTEVFRRHGYDISQVIDDFIKVTMP